MKVTFVFIALICLLSLVGCNDKRISNSFSPTPPPETTNPPDPSIPMNFYFGNLHSHTKFSDGSGTPEQAFDWARLTAGYDFYVVSDHAEQISSSEWSATGAGANEKNVDNKFVALRGFEWTHRRFGHITVLNTASYTGAINTPEPSDFYAWIDRNDGLAQFNHPGREPLVFGNFDFLDIVYDHFFAVETGNKNAGNNNGQYLDYFSTALQNGWRVAPTNNQDNHILSTNSHRSVIIAPALTRDDLLDALRERRLYSSDDPNLKLTFKSGDYWMGSNIVGEAGLYTFFVSVTDDEPIEKIQFLNKSGTVLDTQIPPTGRTATSASFTANVFSYDCFYVKVYGKDTNNDDPGYAQQIAVSAPIWVYPQ